MSAFGPFAGTQEIDFGALGDCSLFLIHGPTGSGKTTLLDAMCFALYGESSGEERQARNMRSDHAAPGTPTSVRFEFAVGDRAYRVERSPEYDRPSKRGGGTVKAAHRVSLETRRLGDGPSAWTVTATKADQVRTEVERILGFKSAQFRQVMMLPQGKFGTFLKANSTEREKILEVLFQTWLYRRIEERLKERARGVREEWGRAGERKALLLGQAGVESLEQLDAVLAGLRAELGRLGGERAAADRELRAARERLDAAREVNRLLAEAAAAGEELRRVEAFEEGVRARRELLARAEKALPLAAAHEQVSAREREAREAREQAGTAAAGALAAAERQAQARELHEREERRADERRAAEHRVERLRGALHQAQELEQARREVAAAGARETEARARLAGCEAAFEAAGGALAAVQERRGRAGELARMAGERRRSLRVVEEAAARVRQLEVKRAELVRAGQASADAAAALAAAEAGQEEAVRRLREQERLWQRTQAARLAGTLVAGAPCPVCGSPHHPAPASADAAPVGEGELEALQAELDRREGAIRELRLERETRATAVTRLEVEVGMIRSAQEAHGPPEELAASLARAKDQLDEAEAAAGRLAALEAEERRLAGERERLRAGREAGIVELREAEGARNRAESLVDARTRDLPEGLGSRERVAEAHAGAERLRDELQQAWEEAQRRWREASSDASAAEQARETARHAAAQAEARLSGQEAALGERIAAGGFASREDFLAALLPAARVEALRDEIAAHDARRAAARQRLERAAAAAQGLTARDLAPVEEQVRVLDGRGQALAGEEARVGEKAARAQEAADRYREEERGSADLERRYGVLGRLAEVAGGENALKMNFHRFVLSTLLDEVLTAASERLQIMSRHRFRLVRTPEVAYRQKTGGLELEVYDAHTDTRRPANTLSGGESFLASLSLALGMADVVQAHAGGIRLETIFVDEGFGSLDAEALDQAFNALLDLRAGGRLVGVISHVAELRERIDARLEVVPGRNGSVARLVVP
jgi:exonuclease SbcC